MLVLSRRPDQEVTFPNIGVSLKVLTVRGRIVKLGIEAPDDIEIVRPEATKKREVQPQRKRQTYVSRHDLRNRLNNVKLAAAVFERQQELGLENEARDTFDRLVKLLQEMEQSLEAEKSAEKTSQQTEAPAAPQRLLVVEDDDNERELLSGLLKLYGFEVTTCADGAEALAALARGPKPDMVLLDMKMPRCDGIELVDRIRQNEELRDLTLYAVSGTDPHEMGMAADGVNDWFPKPLDPTRLINVLKTRSAEVKTAT